jgi:hypothetical protein
MSIRKIAVVGGFAAGAALAFAPLASADDFSSILDSEIASLNGIFEGDAALAGDSGDVTLGGTGAFDTITPADIATVQGDGTTPFDYLIYGVDPTEAGLASDPGSYNVFNGALTEFYDASNVELYSLLNNGDLIPAADLFGSSTSIADGLASSDPAEFFFNFGLGDLEGFLGIFSSI